MTTTMAMAQRAMARQDTTTKTMATGDNDNDVNGDGATGNEVDDDGDGATGDDNEDNNDGDDDDDGEGDGVMGSGTTGYDDNDDGDGQGRGRRQQWRDNNDADADANDDGNGASDATARGGMAGGTRRRVAIKNDDVNLSNIISYLAEVSFFYNYLHSRRAGVVVARDNFRPPPTPASNARRHRRHPYDHPPRPRSSSLRVQFPPLLPMTRRQPTSVSSNTDANPPAGAAS